MSAKDWHGECHANGMSGRCGFECPVFLRLECEAEDEIIGSININSSNVDTEIVIDLLGIGDAIDRIGFDVVSRVLCDELRINILKSQTKVKLTDIELIEKSLKG